jgi:hypothetical protein
MPLAPNCTSCIQPLDVAINGPFKKLVRGSYRSWMIKEIEKGVSAIPPIKEDIIMNMVLDAWDNVKFDSIINSKKLI